MCFLLHPLKKQSINLVFFYSRGLKSENKVKWKIVLVLAFLPEANDVREAKIASKKLECIKKYNSKTRCLQVFPNFLWNKIHILVKVSAAISILLLLQQK